MARAEFYEVIIKLKENDLLSEVNIIEVIKKHLEELPENDLLCNHKTCLAILSDIVLGEESATFDFSKLTNEVIDSTIISKPLDSVNTFE